MFYPGREKKVNVYGMQFAKLNLVFLLILSQNAWNG